MFKGLRFLFVYFLRYFVLVCSGLGKRFLFVCDGLQFVRFSSFKEGSGFFQQILVFQFYYQEIFVFELLWYFFVFYVKINDFTLELCFVMQEGFLRIFLLIFFYDLLKQVLLFDFSVQRGEKNCLGDGDGGIGLVFEFRCFDCFGLWGYGWVMVGGRFFKGDRCWLGVLRVVFFL